MNAPSSGTAKEYLPCRFLNTRTASDSVDNIWLIWLLLNGFASERLPVASTVSCTMNSESQFGNVEIIANNSLWRSVARAHLPAKKSESNFRMISITVTEVMWRPGSIDCIQTSNISRHTYWIK